MSLGAGFWEETTFRLGILSATAALCERVVGRPPLPALRRSAAPGRGHVPLPGGRLLRPAVLVSRLRGGRVHACTLRHLRAVLAAVIARALTKFPRGSSAGPGTTSFSSWPYRPTCPAWRPSLPWQPSRAWPLPWRASPKPSAPPSRAPSPRPWQARVWLLLSARG